MRVQQAEASGRPRVYYDLTVEGSKVVSLLTRLDDWGKDVENFRNKLATKLDSSRQAENAFRFSPRAIQAELELAKTDFPWLYSRTRDGILALAEFINELEGEPSKLTGSAKHKE